MKKLEHIKYALVLVLTLFLVGCPPYAVTILTPSDGDYFDVGELIIFTGSAQDFQEGILTGDSLVWTSSTNGQIGAGNIVIRDDLSEGTHTITLTATNSLGETGTASITITLYEETPPTTTTTTIPYYTTTITTTSVA